MNYRILHTEWSDGWGGQEQRIILECRKMQERGEYVVIACQPGSGILAKAEKFGIPTEEVVMRGSIDPLAVFGLYRVIRKHRINVVSTHSGKDSWPAGMAAKLARVELLVRTRHLSVPIKNGPFNIVYRMPDGIVTTGVAIRETMIADNGIPADKIVSIATGVSLERFDPGRTCAPHLKRELGVPENAPVVTMVAVLRTMKRHDLLIAAAAKLRSRFPEARYLLVGDGPAVGWVEELVRDAGMEDRIILAGYRDDVPDLLSISDVFVLSSDRNEGVPQSISQAMAMACPVVASPIGSIPELILDGETGLLARTGDPSAFAEAIGRLLEDQPLRALLGRAARAHVLAGYTDEIMTQKTLDFYRYLQERKSA